MENPDFWPENPYPKSVFTMPSERYIEVVPDPDIRTGLSGMLGREFWDIASEEIWEAIKYYLEALERVEKAAKTIFDLTKFPHKTMCPHGTIPHYPTSPWWCDDCWGELEDALTAMEIEREVR